MGGWPRTASGRRSSAQANGTNATPTARPERQVLARPWRSTRSPWNSPACCLKGWLAKSGKWMSASSWVQPSRRHWGRRIRVASRSIGAALNWLAPAQPTRVRSRRCGVTGSSSRFRVATVTPPFTRTSRPYRRGESDPRSSVKASVAQSPCSACTFRRATVRGSVPRAARRRSARPPERAAA